MRIGAGGDDANQPLVSGRRIDAARGILPGSSRPRVAAVDDLTAQRAPHWNPDLYFLPKEKAVADWLRAEGGHVVISVDRRGDMKTPDSILRDGSRWRTVEIKTLEAPTAAALQRRLRVARHQSRIAVIDGYGVGLSSIHARSGITEAVRNFGPDFDQIVIRVADGTALLWLA